MSSTRILLLEDVDSLGRKGDIASVRPGYAYNYLIPQGFALIADKAALRRQVRLQEERRAKAEEEKKESQELASRLGGETIETHVKVDHEGHMYGSVSALDIVHMLQEKTGIVLEKKVVQLKHPIKEVGVFTITLRFKEEITADVQLKILPEEE